MISVKLGSAFLDVAMLQDYHATSLAQMQAAGMIVV
jgi:hypothetical protein